MLLLVLFLVGCKEDNKSWDPYSPHNTSSLMNQYALNEDYRQFQSLVLEGSEQARTQEIYETVKQSVSNSAEIVSFTLVKMDNGKTLLVHLTPPSGPEQKALIQNVLEVPEDMVVFFEEALGK